MSKRNLTIFNETYTDVAGFKVKDTNNSTLTYVAESDMGTDVWVDDKSVFFYDYDGELVYSYSAAEAQLMTELPPNPSHTGLTAQGWNWTLAEIKSQLTNVGGDVVVGQHYTTDDGKSRFYITIEDDNLADKPINLRIKPSVATGVTIDWGDGSATETTNSTNNTYYTHIYENAGDYVITCQVTEGTVEFLGNTSGNQERIYGSSNNNATWYDRTRITKVEIGNSCTNVKNCFKDCWNLKTITIPNTVIDITDCIDGCHSLKQLTIPKATNGSTSASTFSMKALCLPYTVKSLPASMCYNRGYSLEHITVPEKVTTIGRFCFAECHSLKKIVFPNGVTGWDDSTVSGAIKIEKFSFPSELKRTGGGTIRNSYSLKKVILPENLISISGNDFEGCRLLEDINLPNTLNIIGDSAFYGCKNIGNIKIPNGVVYIGNSAFRSIPTMTNLTLPEELLYMGDYIFYENRFLTKMIIPNKIPIINQGLFERCNRISYIAISSNVVKIAQRAFCECFSLKELHMHPSIPPTLDNVNAFTSVPSDLVIYVPKGSLSAYQGATNWSTYASYMQEDNIDSISCTYTQSGTVYNTDALETLKDDLVVTVNYDDNTSETITDYALSGKLSSGTSIVTVTYGGKTTTFNVTVTEATLLHNWDFTSSLTDSVGNITAVLSSSGATRDSSGLSITSASGYCTLGSLSNNTNLIVEIDISSMSRQGTSNGRLFMQQNSNNQVNGGQGVVVNHNSGNSYWGINMGKWTYRGSVPYIDDLAGKTLTLVHNGTDNIKKLYLNNSLICLDNQLTNKNTVVGWQIGSSTTSFYNVTITGLRVYSL